MRVLWIKYFLATFFTVLLHGGKTMVGSIDIYTESQGDPRADKSINRKGTEKPVKLEVNGKNPFDYNLAESRAFLTSKHHRVVKRNASAFIPPFFLPTPPPIAVVCEAAKSCLGRCTNNRTEWKTEAKMTCSCDPDCYEVFNDCCADYVKYCGVQNAQNVPAKQYKWNCVNLGNIDERSCSIADGIWMVAECSSDWPHDTTRTKCETPLQQLTVSSPDLARHLPVISRHNITFRNHFCALCNNVNDVTHPWPLNIETSIIPPENYNVTQKIQFLLSQKAEIIDKGPKSSQSRRYCLTEQLTDTCANGKSSSSCVSGTTAIVWAGRNLKNLDCAFCNGIGINDISCYPVKLSRLCLFFTSRSFSLVLDYQGGGDNSGQSEFSVEKQGCASQGMVYNDVLQVCQVNWLDPPDQNGQARFFVVVWFSPQWVGPSDFSAEDFQKSFVEYLNVSSNQVFDVNISTIVKPDTFRFVRGQAVVDFYLASSTLILSPQQSLELLSVQRNSRATATKPRLANFIYFKDPFVVNIKNLNYTVVKTTSRPLACSGRKSYTPEEYTLLDRDRLYINSTNTTYKRSQYFRENIQQLNDTSITLGDNITVCEEYIPTGCKATWLILAPTQFTILTNLSIYHNETSSLHHYGQYDVLSNGSVAVCVSFFDNSINIYQIRDNKVLGIITSIGFILSILLLIFLLVTYIWFPHLRTLPGKNLMNLATTLLLFELFWVLANFDGVRKVKSLCTAVAIIEHYCLLANFVSMSIIAFHTCKVFARQTLALRSLKSHERKLFIIYSMLVWFVPAMFIALLSILDKKEIVNVGYGDSDLCFLGSQDSYTYFMAIPVAALLLFNIVAFITSVVYLRKHSQNTAAKHAARARRSNLSIYMKLSTLMGFSWLFALLTFVFDMPVFWYLFVILSSLQGVFITVAFALNAKTLKLYRRSTRVSQKSSNTRTRTTTTRKLACHVYQDTKL